MFSFLCEVTRVIYNSLKTLYDDNSNDFVTASLTLDCFRQCLMTSDAVYKKKLEEYFVHVGDAAENGKLYHEQVLSVIETIHGLLEKSLDEDNSICGAAGRHPGNDLKKMQQNTLHCMEILYSYLPAQHAECAAVATWLYNFCLNNVIDGKHLDGIFKLLFTQRLKYFDGDFFSSVAIQLSRVLGTVAVIEGEPAFELKAITKITADAVLLHLFALLRKDIEDVEVTILKAKSMTSKIKFLGDGGADDDREWTEMFFLNYKVLIILIVSFADVQSLKTMERSICAHLIHIANTLIHLANSLVHIGTPSDALVRLLTQFYICLNNVAKHLIARHMVMPVVYSHIKFDKLIQISGKPLAGRVYDLITYIDKNLIPEEGDNPNATTAAAKKKAKASPEKNRKKVMRETRSVPKMIRWIETLHKYVLSLGKRTKKDLSAYLHMGIVRDFRIKNSQLPGDMEDDDADENRINNSDSDREEDDDNNNSEVDSDVTVGPDVEVPRKTATAKILKNVAKLKGKAAVVPKKKTAPVRAKRSRPAVVVPDVTGILNAINENAGPKSPVKKRPRRSAKSGT